MSVFEKNNNATPFCIYDAVVDRTPSIRLNVQGGVVPYDVTITDGSSNYNFIVTASNTNQTFSFPSDISTSTTYEIVSVVDKNVLVADPGANPFPAPITFNVDDIPITYTITGGVVCEPGPLSVGLSNSEIGVDYELLLNGNPISPAQVVAGTGTPLNPPGWTVSANGTYSVVARRGHCEAIMNGAADVNALPVDQAFDQTGIQCGTGTVELQNSETGAMYRLYRDNVYLGIELNGSNGNTVSFPAQTIAGTYTVEAFTTGSLPICSRWMTQSLVVVNPSDYVLDAVGGVTTYCQGAALSGISLFTNGSQAGNNYTLRNTFTNTDFGVAKPGNGGPLTWNDVPTGAYQMITTTPDGCYEYTNTITVTEKSLPTASIVNGNFERCANTIAPPGGYNITVDFTGTAPFSYTLVDNAAIPNQYPFIANGLSDSRSFNPSSTTTYSLLNVTDASGCSSNLLSGSTTITVKSVSAGIVGPNEVCENGTVVLEAMPNIPGYTYLWSNAQTTPSVSVVPNTADFNYSVTVTSSDGCEATAYKTITVHPLPVATFSGLGPDYCFNDAAVALSGNPLAPGIGAFYLIKGAAAPVWLGGNTFTPSLVGDASADVSAQVYYTFTDDKGCYDESPKQTVNIHPLPNPTIVNLDNVYCQDSPDVVVYGNPAGGTFSVTGAGLDYTAVAGSGAITIRPSTSAVNVNYTINYTFGDASGCTAVVSEPTNVVDLNAGVLSFDNLLPAYCQGDPVVYNIRGLVNGIAVADGQAIISGNGISQTVAQQSTGEATFSPALAGVGKHVVTFTYTSISGCAGVVTMEVVVGADLGLTGLKPVFCANEPAVNLVGSPSGGRFEVLSSSGAPYTVNNSTYLFDPATLMSSHGAGNYDITYVLPDSPVVGCNSSKTWQTMVSALPEATISGLSDNYCINDAPPSLLTQLNSVPGDSPSFSGPGVSGILFNPALAGIGTHSVNSQVVNASGCVSVSSKSTNVVALPILSIVGLHDACESDAPYTFTVSNAAANGTFTFSCFSSIAGQQPLAHVPNNPFATFDPSVGEGVYVVEYSFVPDPATGNGCSQTISQTVTVHRTDAVGFSGLSSQYCQTDLPVLLSGSFGSGIFTSSAPGNLGITNQLTAGVPNGTAVFDPSALLPGNYTITYSYTNAAGCTSIATQPVSIVGLPIQFAVTGGGSYCKGAAVGASVSLANSEAGNVYELLINGLPLAPAYAITSAGGPVTFTDIKPIGTYTVVARNALGCESFMNGNVMVSESELLLTTTFSNETCENKDDGQATVSVSGGVSPYAYNWQNSLGTSVSTSDFAQNLPAEIYTITVTDVLGCSASKTGPINEPLPISIGLTTKNSTCDCSASPGDCDGAASVLITGGTPSYSVGWSSGQSGYTVGGLGTGAYTVSVTDANGCVEPLAFNIGLIGAPISVAEVLTSHIDVVCNGLSNGRFEVVASGGSGSYEYSIDGANWFTNPIFNNLSAGSYNVFVRDVANSYCVASIAAPIVISQPDALSLSVVSKKNIGCFGINNGELEVLPGGGSGVYDYSINGGSSWQPLPVFTGLSAGNQYVWVRDANATGCENRSLVVDIEQPLPIDFSVAKTDLSCNGSGDGQITVTPIGGNSASVWGYSIDNGTTWQAGNSFAGLVYGTYDVLLRDEQATACMVGPKSVALSEPMSIGVALAVGYPIDVQCFGANTGSLALEAIPLGASLEYSLEVAGAPVRTWQASPLFTNLPAGTYTVLVRNGSCLNSNALTVVVKGPVAPLSIDSHVLTDVTCPVNSTVGATGNGSISVSVSGGTSSYSFQWFNATNGAPVPVSSGGNTHQISNVLAGDYKITITDAVGCVSSSTYTITQPDTWDTQYSSSNLTAVGANDGTIDVTLVSGGLSPYSIEWSDGIAYDGLYTRNNLAVGNYTYTITDGNGCKYDETVGVFDSNALSASLVEFNNSCYGASAGQIDVIVTNGSPNYNVTWTGNTYLGVAVSGSASNVVFKHSIKNLQAGNYVVIVTDNNGTGASIMMNAVISQPASPLALSYTVTDVTCFNAKDGRVSVSVSGGTPYLPGEYDISLLPVQTVRANNHLFSGLSTGAYEIVVADEAGCLLNQTIAIVQPNELIASVVATDVDCSGSTTGTLTASVTGRAVGAPFSYYWETHIGTMWVPYFSGGNAFVGNVPAGVYRVLATSLVDGCSAYSGAVTVSQSSALSMTVDAFDVATCSGDASGRLVINTSGGVAPYVLEYWGNASGILSGNGLFDIQNIPAGNYQLQLSDAKSCQITQTVSILEPLALNVSNVLHAIGCDNPTDGALSFDVTGGVAESGNQQYYALLQGPSMASYVQTAVVASGGVANFTFINLPVGHYNLEVRDINSSDPVGCRYNYSFNLSNIVIGGDATDATCVGVNNGSILNVSTAGAEPGFTWAWSTADGSGLNVATLNQGGLSAGQYTLTVTDGVRGCVVAKAFNIKNSSVLAIDATQHNVVCYGGNNGAVIVHKVDGATAPISYYWNGNGASGQPSSLTDLSAGAVQLTVTDANGCAVINNYLITEPTAISFDLSTNLAACSPYDREIVLSNLAGGSGTISSFNYSFSGPGLPTWQASSLSGMDVANPANPLLKGLSVGGTYQVSVYDINNCMSSQAIDVFGDMVLSTSVGNVTCSGGNTGTIVLDVTGGSGTYQYAWTKLEDALFAESTKDLSILTAGHYVVVVTDMVQGCSKSLTVNVQQPLAMDVSGAIANVGCAGVAEGQIALAVSGGVGPYTYLWNTADGSGINPIAKDQSGLSGGTYQVTVTDSSLPIGCSAVQTFKIEEVAPLSFDLVLSNRNCNGTADLELQNILGGTGSTQIVWSGPGITSAMQNQPALIGLPAGTYTATLVDLGHANCSLTKSVTITAEIKVESIISLPQTCSSIPDGSIDVTQSGGVAPLTYSWATAIVGGNLVPGNLDQNGLKSGLYELTVTDGAGCSLVTNVLVDHAPTMTLSGTVLPELCYGANNGSIDLLVTGGVGPYNYNWVGTGVALANQDQTALGNGSYTVTVLDLGSGCEETALFVVLGPTLPLQLDLLSQTNINCKGDASGSISVVASGGTPGYSYVWSGPGSLITGNNQSGLVAGNYSVFAIDANNCQSSVLDLAVTEPGLVLSATLDNVVDVASYGDATGQISVSVSGGNGSYVLVWTGVDYLGNAVSIPNNTYSPAGLLAGQYQVSITDGNGCNATISNIIVRQPGELFKLTAIGVDVKPCSGSGSGSINAFVTGGDAPYTLKLYNGAGTLLSSQTSGGYTFDLLVPDVYLVEATDGNGVVLTQNVAVQEPLPISLLATVHQNVDCRGDLSGIINVEVNGGLPNGLGHYKVIVSGNGYYDERTDVAASTTSIFTGLASGNYWVRVVDDANGDGAFNFGSDCSADAMLQVVQPEALVTLSGATTVCAGGVANVTLSVSNWPNVSLNPLEVTLSNGSVVTVNSSPMFYSYVPSSSEVLTITNVAVGVCNKGSGTGSATVVLNNRPTATIIGHSAICNGQSSPIAFYLTGNGPWEITYTDGSANYQISNIVASPYVINVAPIVTTTYALVNVADGLCSQSYLPSNPLNQATVTVNVLPSVSMGGSTTICEGQSTALDFAFASGTAPWNVVVDEVGIGEFSIPNIGVSPFSYTVSPSQTTVYELRSVTDANGCSSSVNGTVSVLVNPLPENPGAITGKLTVCQGELGVAYSIAPVANATAYVWELPVGFTLVAGGNESVLLDVADSAVSGFIRVHATNSCGASQTKSEFFVTVSPLPQKPMAVLSNLGNSVCQGTSGLVFSVDAVSNATSYLWQVPGGFNIVSGQGTPVLMVDLDPAQSNVSGDVVVTALNSCGAGDTSDPLTVTINALPLAFAGNDEYVCGPSTSLTATPPTAGQIGTWRVVSGAALLSSYSAHNADVTNLAIGETVLEWSVTDLASGCVSVDLVSVFNSQYPVTAWSAQNSTCFSSANVSGTSVDAITGYSGHWSFVQGSGFFVDASAANTVVTGLSPNLNVLRWTVKHSSGCQSFADVSVVNNQPSPAVITNKASLANICDDKVTVEAILPVEGIGKWSLIKGGALFDDENSAIVNVTQLAKGENILRWTVSKNGCSVYDDVTVNNNLLTVDAGPDIITCQNYIDQLQGTVPPVGAVSHWYVESVGGVPQGSAAFSNASIYNTRVYDLGPNENRLVWELNLNGCISRDVVSITSNTPTTAVVGVAYAICADTSQLSANVAVEGDGFWTVVSGGGTFDDPTDANTIVRNTKEGVNTFRWNIAKNGCFSSADLSIENKKVEINAGKDFAVCLNHTVLDADEPLKGTGEWSVMPGMGAGSFLPNNKVANPTVGGMMRGVNGFVWTVTNDGCATSDVVYVINNASSDAKAGPDLTLFSPTANLQAVPVGLNEIGTWSIIAGGATISNLNDPFAKVTNLQQGPNVFRWTVNHLGCTSFDEVTYTYGTITMANAGVDQNICLFETNLQANNPGVGVGEWSIVKGFGQFDNNRSYQTVVRNLGPGENIFRWTIYYVNSSSSDEVSIINTTPTVAKAGPDRTICADTYELEGNVPEEGDALWTIISGKGTIANVDLPNATVTGLAKGVNILKYEIKKLGCSSIDSVRIVNDLPSEANAGIDETLCTDSVQLKPNNPTFGIGVWRVVEGSAEISDNWAKKLTPGVSKLVWQVSTSSCHSIDTLVINNNTPTSAFAGFDQPICVDTVKLQGNLAERGIGHWELLTGTGTILDSADPQTIVRGLGRGSNRFRWVVDNKGCTTSDDVEISNNLIPSYAGYDQVNCADSAYLVASNPYPGIGAWGVLPGSGSGKVVFDKPESAFTVVRKLEQGENILTWTVDYKGCVSVSNVSVTNNNPSAAHAGPDQQLCQDNVVLGANAPEIGTGQWSIRNGNGTFSDVNEPFTSVSQLGFGSNIFRWSIENNGCVTFDDVEISSNMVKAVVGPDQSNLCSNSTVLQANNALPGIGTWSVVGGTSQASFVDMHDPNTTVNNLGRGMNTLRWTIINAGCVSWAEMAVTNNSPTVAYAGSNQTLCTNTTQLDATPLVQTLGVGQWEVLTGSAVFANASDPKTQVSGLANGDNVLRWRLTNGSCISDDEVLVVNNQPSLPYAGADDLICSLDYQLKATSPEFGQGIWSIEKGAGTLANPNLSVAEVTNMGFGENIFKWTVSKGQCELSDHVTINNQSASVANAGNDIQDCKSTALLDANSPVHGSGTWSLVSGYGELALATDGKTTVSNLGFGENIFQWTIQNGSCFSSDLVSVFNKMPDQSFAGDDKTICENRTVLNANNPLSGSGMWRVISGNGQFAEPTFYNSLVTDIGFGQNIYEWTISYGQCSTSDVVTVTSNNVGSFAGDDDVTYVPSYQLKASNPGLLSGQWSILGGSGSFADASYFNTTVSGLSEGINTFRWTVTVNGCEFVDDVAISYKIAPEAAFVADVTQGCLPLKVQFTNFSVGGSGFVWDFGDGTTSTERNPKHSYDVAGTFSATLTVSENDGTSASYSQTINVNPLPQPQFSISSPKVFIPGGSVRFYNMSIGSTSYFWDFGDGNVSQTENPAHEYTEMGTYDVTLTVGNQFGCRDSLSSVAAVEVEQQGFVVFPNAFMPRPDASANNMGNERFKPKYQDVDEFHMQIYDRWGQLIFETTDINAGWDGKYKDQLSMQDVYVYKAWGRYVSGKEFWLTGNVMLVR